MTSFKTFLSEDTRSSEISEREAATFIKNNCPKYKQQVQKDGVIIYRGVSKMINSPTIYINPIESSSRVSANVTNEYTLIMSNHSSWKEYPPRSHSIVCSTVRTIAAGYGQPYVVFPPDGTKIGVASATDLWGSFSYMADQLEDINYLDIFADAIHNTIRYVLEQTPEQNDWDQFKQQLQQVTKQLPKTDLKWLHYKSQQLVEYAKQHFNGDFFQTIVHLLDPKKNNFQLETANRLVEKHNEVWLSNQSVLIHAQAVKSVLQLIDDGTI